MSLHPFTWLATHLHAFCYAKSYLHQMYSSAVGRDLKRWSSSNSHDVNRDTFHKTRLLRALSTLALNASQRENIHTQLSWATCSSAYYPHRKEFLPNIYFKSTLFQCESIPPYLSCRLPSGNGRLQLGHHEAISFPGWTIPILSAFLHRTGVPSL